jgi:single-strand DNA-binding protein
MSGLRNRVTLIGRLGRDPEVKTFDSGKTKASFSLATKEFYRNAEGETVEGVEWHNVVFWGKPAKVAGEYLKKGKEVAIEGRISYRNYEDKEGQKRSITEIVGNDLVLIDRGAN